MNEEGKFYYLQSLAEKLCNNGFDASISYHFFIIKKSNSAGALVFAYRELEHGHSLILVIESCGQIGGRFRSIDNKMEIYKPHYESLMQM